MSSFLFVKKIYNKIVSYLCRINPETSYFYKIISYPYNLLSSISLSHYAAVRNSFVCRFSDKILKGLIAVFIVGIPFADIINLKVITFLLALIYYISLTVYDDFGKKPSEIDVFIYLFYILFMPYREMYWLIFYIVFTSTVEELSLWKKYGFIFLIISALSAVTSHYLVSDIELYSEIYALTIPFGIAFLKQVNKKERIFSVFLLLIILLNYYFTISKGVFSVTTLLFTALISVKNFKYTYIFMFLSGLLLNFTQSAPFDTLIDNYNRTSGLLYFLFWILLSLILFRKDNSKKPILRSMLAALGCSSTAFAGKPIAYTDTFSALFWVFLSLFSSTVNIRDNYMKKLLD